MKIPASLASFSKHQQIYCERQKQSLTLAPSILQDIDDFLQKTIQESEFCMCVPLSVLPMIITSDVFKSQMEVERGATMGGKETRKTITEALFGCDCKALSPSQYPKYGMLMDKNIFRQLCIDPDVVYHYGNVIVTFKKEAVLRRTTMCVGTSLDFGEYKYKCPVLVTKPGYCCIRANAKEPAVELLKFHHHIQSGELKADAPWTLYRTYDGALGYEFYELQFHGRLSLARDVERVDLFPMGSDDEERFQTCSSALDKLHIAHDILAI